MCAQVLSRDGRNEVHEHVGRGVNSSATAEWLRRVLPPDDPTPPKLGGWRKLFA